MLDILFDIVMWYLKIGLGVYLVYNVLIIIKNGIMPWDFLILIFLMVISPIRLLKVLVTSIAMIITWPIGVILIIELFKPEKQG